MAPKRRKQHVRQVSDAQPPALQGLVRIEGPGEKLVPFTGNPSQGLKFVDVTPRYLKGSRNSEEQKSIRVHVMQDYLRQKKLPIDTTEPPAMAGTVSDHVHRFRISKPRPREDKHTEPVSSEQVVICPEEDGQSTCSRSPATASIRGSLGLQNAGMAHTSPCGQSTLLETVFAEPRDPASPPRILPNLPGVVARMDPFARLPIDGTIQTHEIIDYYRTSYWSNSLAVNPDGRWFSVAATDPALFHAQLSLVSQHQALVRGTSFPESYYYHRGMAISIVTSRLVHPVEAISDPTIGAVALLANADNYLDVPAEIPPGVHNSHIKGLLSLVQLRGGLHTLSTNESVKRVVTWADLVYATSNDTVPCLGISKCNAGYDLKELFPDSTSAGCLVRMVYPEQPPVPAPLKEIVETLRLCCIAQSSPDRVDLKSTVNRRVLANVLYRIEYMLLDPLLLPLTGSEGEEGWKQSNYSDFWTPLFSATTAGILIFTYSCLRNLMVPSRPYERLVRRLRRNLQLVFEEEELSRASEKQSWPLLEQNRNASSHVQADPGLLLWLLMHGFKGTVGTERKHDRAWFVRRGAEVCKELEIDCVEELGMQIKQVVIFRVQCVPTTQAFWKAICESEREERTCE